MAAGEPLEPSFLRWLGVPELRRQIDLIMKWLVFKLLIVLLDLCWAQYAGYDRKALQVCQCIS